MGLPQYLGLDRVCDGRLLPFSNRTNYISSKISMLIMTLAPPVAAILGWFMLGERFSLMNALGMFLVIFGVSLVIMPRRMSRTALNPVVIRLKAWFFAFLGAIGQGVGAVFSKIGMGDYDPFASSQIRVITGIFGFAIMISVMKRWKGCCDRGSRQKSF
jgi:uncharacterized membrane protein